MHCSAPFSTMSRSSHLLFASLFLVTSLAAHGADSLYNEAESRRLTSGERAAFGQRSAELRYDARMIRASEIAQRRAQPQMTWHCWKYVKDALLAANVVTHRPTTLWAKDAGAELSEKFGFHKLSVRSPYDAPVGAVVVYGGADGGHVELRTADGFVSDFISRKAYPRPLVGVYVKRS